jgi:hypothetical protein
MKAKELAEKLLENPDFEITTVFRDKLIKSEWPVYRKFNILGIGDIGYSDKIIQLEVEEV